MDDEPAQRKRMPRARRGGRPLRRVVAGMAVCVAFLSPAAAAEAIAGVAANFLTTARQLVDAFEAQGDHEIVLAHGSTGRLYAQIVQGAPFDLYLAADADRPARLAGEGRSAPPVTYALGRLVAVSRPGTAEDWSGLRVAIADPEVAPYGQAAMEVLAGLGHAETVTLVYGDSVGQTATLFATGNADVGLIAASQLPDLPVAADVLVLDDLHAPLRQDAVLTIAGRDNPAATAFFEFLQGAEARAIITAAGYGLPG